MGGKTWIKIAAITFFFLATISSGNSLDGDINSYPGVKVYNTKHHQVVLDNGVIKVEFSNPIGEIIGIQYNGYDNILEPNNALSNRGYFDIVWSGTTEHLEGTDFRIVRADDEQVEISFARKWDVSMGNSTVPLNIDKRYVLRRGDSGFYTYGILERDQGGPDVSIDQIRVVYKLRKSLFNFMALSDDIQRVMPSEEDRNHGQRLDYAEAILLTNPSNPDLKGEVDDKYQYSLENKDSRVYGWMSKDAQLGFWMIVPSDEFRSGGPIKQDLTAHAGPTLLGSFVSNHYAGDDMDRWLRNGEPWKKVFGPVFVYLDSIDSSNGDHLALWQHAKQKVKNWPYNFMASEDLPPSDQRGTVTGQLLVVDRNEGRLTPATHAYVGLAPPGDVGSWQTNVKGYQFWITANEDGYFTINNIRAGEYNLYAWVPGVLGDYKYTTNIVVNPGSDIKLEALTFDPPRNGPTLWEIGIPDRSAAEFYIPDAYPELINKMYNNAMHNNHNHPQFRPEKFRQYGLWRRYADLFPDSDLVYDVGVSNHTKDWFFAHVTRKTGDNKYSPTTWQIRFNLDRVSPRGDYTLQLSLASATTSQVQVRFNNPYARRPHFSTGLIGRDNAIARHGIHGLHRLYSFRVPNYLLRRGLNTIYLRQSRSNNQFCGVMYDYIRLEGPQ